MPAIRFYCLHCQASLLTNTWGKLGKCPKCSQRVQAPENRPVKTFDGVGRIIACRDWLPGEVEEIVKKFPGRSRRARKMDEAPLPDLPEELGTEKAARILNCSKDTVLRYKDAGLLEFRDLAPPGSTRPVYAFTLQSVLALRTGYTRESPTAKMPQEPPRRRVKGQREYQHLTIQD